MDLSLILLILSFLLWILLWKTPKLNWNENLSIFFDFVYFGMCRRNFAVCKLLYVCKGTVLFYSRADTTFVLIGFFPARCFLFLPRCLYGNAVAFGALHYTTSCESFFPADNLYYFSYSFMGCPYSLQLQALWRLWESCWLRERQNCFIHRLF